MAVVRPLAASCAGTLMTGLVVLAQGQAPFSGRAELVPVTVTVQTANGSYASDLAATSFHVFDNGSPRSIQLFDGGAAPTDLILLLDTSSSVNARLPTMQNAATRLVRALHGDDRAMLMAFGAGTRIVEPLTTDRGRVARGIAGLSCRGTTSLYDALYVALHQFSGPGDTQTIRRRAIVVFTDGEDTASLIGFDAVLDAARRMAVATYTIRLVSPFEHVDRFARAAVELRQLARETGARAFTSAGTKETAVAYEAVAGDLTHQYVLGFEPEGPAGVHTITVAVDAPHARILNRSGYVAE